MTHRPSREHRILVLAVASLAVLPITAARSQALPDSTRVDSARAHPARAAAESIAVLPAVHLPATTIGASVATIDSAEIASSGARTLSELLLARVPGLSVRRRGGTETDGSEVRSRGMTSTRGAAPMLVVDGIVADANQSLPVPGTSIGLSRLDDLTPADVRRIQVLHGPAAGALYGPGAASGVIVVTTQRGGAGPLRLDVSAAAGLTDVGADFPANYQLTNGTPGQTCNPRLFAPQPAGCTPTTLYQWNPLEQASPFRVGRIASGRAAISGTTLGTQLFAGVFAEQAGGVTSDDRQSRTGLRASVDRELPGNVTVSARGSYLERRASVPTRGSSFTMDNVILRGLLGTAYDDSTRGYRLTFNPTAETQIAEPSLSRVTSALRVEWRPRAWLTIDALGGQDRARESGVRSTSYVLGSNTIRDHQVNVERWTSGTLHLAMDARYAAGERLALATYLAYDDARTHAWSLDSVGTVRSGGGYSYKWTVLDVREPDQAATVRQHFGWGDVLDVNAGARWSVGRGISAPFGVGASRNVDASLRLPAFRPGLDLRVRAAAGYTPFPGGPAYEMVPTSFGLPSYRAVYARQGEREAGIDATFGARARLALTYFSAQARNVNVGDAPGPPTAGYAITPVFGDVRNRGVEALASAQLVEGSRLGWRTTLSVTTLKNDVTSDRGTIWINGVLLTGYPVRGYWNTGYRWSDANADGIITWSELQFDAPSYVGPSMPTVEVGLRNSVTLPRGLTLGALLDYRGGHYRDNGTEATRCGGPYFSCRGLQDPALPLDEQARWVAVMTRRTRVIEPASFLRVREIVLEWAAPAGAAHSIGAERLTARIVGQNLATWTRYSGIDPEVGEPSLDGGTAPVELFGSPLPRRVQVELRVGTGIGAP